MEAEIMHDGWRLAYRRSDINRYVGRTQLGEVWFGAKPDCLCLDGKGNKQQKADEAVDLWMDGDEQDQHRAETSIHWQMQKITPAVYHRTWEKMVQHRWLKSASWFTTVNSCIINSESSRKTYAITRCQMRIHNSLLSDSVSSGFCIWTAVKNRWVGSEPLTNNTSSEFYNNSFDRYN